MHRHNRRSTDTQEPDQHPTDDRSSDENISADQQKIRELTANVLDTQHPVGATVWECKDEEDGTPQQVTVLVFSDQPQVSHAMMYSALKNAAMSIKEDGIRQFLTAIFTGK